MADADQPFANQRSTNENPPWFGRCQVLGKICLTSNNHPPRVPEIPLARTPKTNPFIDSVAWPPLDQNRFLLDSSQRLYEITPRK